MKRVAPIVVGIISVGLGIALILSYSERGNLDSSLQVAEDNLAKEQSNSQTLSEEVQSLDERLTAEVANSEQLALEKETLLAAEQQLRGEVSSLQEVITARDRDLEGEREETERLTNEVDSLDEKLEVAIDERNSARASATERKSQLDEVESSLQETELSLQGAMDDLEEVTADLTALQDEVVSLDNLRRDRTRLQGQLELVRNQLTTAEGELNTLNSEIDDLERERAALIPMTIATEIACTGSMEPAITCLDEVVILTNFSADEIVIGSVISFESKNCENLDDSGRDYILHRVTAIGGEGRSIYFDTKGDNNPEPDGCRTPPELVEGYIIEINRNVYPGNAQLRDKVNNAEAAYDSAYDEYVRLYTRYCGISPEAAEEDCTLPTREYNAVNYAWEQVEYRRCRYNNALREAEWNLPFDFVPFICLPPIPPSLR